MIKKVPYLLIGFLLSIIFLRRVCNIEIKIVPYEDNR